VTIASQVADRAVKSRKNLLIDGTGAILSKYKKVIRRLQREGYRVEVVGVHAPLSIVQKRIAGRAKATGRHVPPAVVKWYDTQVPCNFLPVAKLADKFSLYDVGGKKPRPVLLARDGCVVKEDRRELARIVSKCALPGGGKGKRR
jgi:predicted ABC-type ATPase